MSHSRGTSLMASSDSSGFAPLPSPLAPSPSPQPRSPHRHNVNRSSDAAAGGSAPTVVVHPTASIGVTPSPAAPAPGGARGRSSTVDADGREKVDGGPCGCIIWHVRTHLLDWLTIIAVGIIALVVTLFIPNHQQLFDPLDPRISYPHLPNTFPNWSVPVMSIPLPLAFIVGFAWFKKGPQAQTLLARRQLGRHVYGLLMANALVIATTQSMKTATGRPRPNCLALGEYYNGTFHASQLTINDAFSSFPSGHSSIICTGMIFLFQFLISQLFPKDVSVRQNQVWRSMICLLPWALAIWVMISRITDYWHDPADVIAGGLLGTSVGFFVYRAHSALPHRRKLASGLGGDLPPNYTHLPRGELDRITAQT